MILLTDKFESRLFQFFENLNECVVKLEAKCVLSCFPTIFLSRYYEAIVEDVLPESETVAVRFEDLGKSDVCQISSLKPLLSDSSKAAAGTSKIQSKANLK